MDSNTLKDKNEIKIEPRIRFYFFCEFPFFQDSPVIQICYRGVGWTVHIFDKFT